MSHWWDVQSTDAVQGTPEHPEPVTRRCGQVVPLPVVSAGHVVDVEERVVPEVANESGEEWWVTTTAVEVTYPLVSRTQPRSGVPPGHHPGTSFVRASSHEGHPVRRGDPRRVSDVQGGTERTSGRRIDTVGP